VAIFLSDVERQSIARLCRVEPFARLYRALLKRVQRRAVRPGLIGPESTCPWWYPAAEYLTDAALAWALEGDEVVGGWLRETTLQVVGRSEDDWIGPPFRDHRATPRVGHLETAHLAWGVAVVLDLAAELFTPAQRDQVVGVLSERAVPLCLRWLQAQGHLANWRCIMTAGVAVPAAVLGDRANMARAVEAFRLSLQIFQSDGSYGESLQYANYAALGLALSHESLVRRDPGLAGQLPIEPYARCVRWFAASHFYSKPLSGWGDEPRPRAANFNDSAAIFRPSGDVLLHIAARARQALPEEAGLARWLFDELYLPCPEQGPWDRMSFGLVNHFGFLTPVLWPEAAAPISPQAAGVPTLAAFGNGDVIARDSWPGRTILALRSGGEPLQGPGHLHGDLHGFILVHNRERLLVDPGHSCYRNLIHELEGSSLTHNTCTFVVDPAEGQTLRHEEQMLPEVRQQERRLVRSIRGGQPEPPVQRGARRLLAEQHGPLSVVVSEAARLYGPPLEEFTRIWLLVGPHVLWVIDRIRACRPVQTTWNWLLNNRDGQLELLVQQTDRLLAHRPLAALSMFHLGEAVLSGPLYAFVHDAYHPLPAQQGEGRPGSGWLMRWQEPAARAERLAIHVIVVDDADATGQWQLRREDARNVLEGPSGRPAASLAIEAQPLRLIVTDQSRRQWRIEELQPQQWRLEQR
jgi:hypothetical protein